MRSNGFSRARAMRAPNGSTRSNYYSLIGKNALDHLDLAPIRAVRGSVRLPGSKSISNRILLLAALARGDTQVRDPLDSGDTRHMLEALRTLGIACHAQGDNSIRVRGADGAIPVKRGDLFLGNAGTAFRPLTAV